MTEVRKLYIFLCGYEIIRKSGCIRNEQPHIILAVPICCYLIETSRGLVLFDTGLDSAGLSDLNAAHRNHVNATFPAPPIVLPEHELLPQLAAIGITPADITDIILSHGHGDHTGHIGAFPRARTTIQKRENEAIFAGAARPGWAHGSINLNVVDGDWRLMPGLDIVFTPGHRPGHQSAVVTLPNSGVKILTGDVADLLENFDREVLGSSTDDIAALESIRRLKAIARETGGQLVPLHDPGFIQTARLAPLFYD